MSLELFHKNLEEARKKLVTVAEKRYKDEDEKEQLITEAREIIRAHKDRTVNFEYEDHSAFQRLIEQVKDYDKQLIEALEHLEKDNPDVIDAIYRLVDCHQLLERIIDQSHEIIKVLKKEDKELA